MAISLTLQSTGRPTAGFARRRPPVTSNVRPRRMSRTTRALVRRCAASQEAFGHRRRAAAGVVAAPGHAFRWQRRTVVAQQREGVQLRLQHQARESAPGKERKCISVSGSASSAAEGKRWSVRGRRCSGSGEVGAPAVTMVPFPSFRSRCRGISNSRVSAAEA